MTIALRHAAGSAIDVPRTEPRLVALDPHQDDALLRQSCARAPAADPFARSAGYFAMTGRKGLWLYGTERTAMLVCRHPNRSDRLLLFPPVGRDGAGLIAAALCDRRLPHGRRQLARVTAADIGLTATFGAKAETEDVLDWTYPVHVVSTAALVARQGGAFNALRGHVHRAERAGYVAAPIDIAHDGAAMRSVAAAWAASKAGAGYTYEDLTGPTESLIALMARGAGELRGVMVRGPQGPAGFWIWDESGGQAASLVRISIGRQGAAELAAVSAAALLLERGITTFCLGGSETRSLDQFKRKLGPVRSVSLSTVTLPEMQTAQVPPEISLFANQYR